MSKGSIVRSRIAAYGRTPKDLLRNPEISANAKVVYAMMDEVSGHEYLSVAKLASWLGLSEQTARRAIHELRDAGWVEVVEKFTHGRQLPNDYYCNGSPTDTRGDSGDTPRADSSDRPSTETYETTESKDSVNANAVDSQSEVENEEIEMEDGELFDAVDVDPVGAKKMQQREEVRAKNKRAQELTATYTALVPLSKFPAVMKVVKRAMGAGYAEDRIETALRHLADDQRAVTVDSLRIAIEQLPPPPRKPQPCPCCTGAHTGLTYDLCAPCRNADHFGVKCTHGPEMLDL